MGNKVYALELPNFEKLIPLCPKTLSFSPKIKILQTLDLSIKSESELGIQDYVIPLNEYLDQINKIDDMRLKCHYNKSHIENKAKIYCPKCILFMCEECRNKHSSANKDHPTIEIHFKKLFCCDKHKYFKKNCYCEFCFDNRCRYCDLMEMCPKFNKEAPHKYNEIHVNDDLVKRAKYFIDTINGFIFTISDSQDKVKEELNKKELSEEKVKAFMDRLNEIIIKYNNLKMLLDILMGAYENKFSNYKVHRQIEENLEQNCFDELLSEAYFPDQEMLDILEKVVEIKFVVPK